MKFKQRICSPGSISLKCVLISCWLVLFGRRLDSNQLVCDCDLVWLATLLRRTPNTETAATCHEPAKLKNRPLVRLTPRDLNCSKYSFICTFVGSVYNCAWSLVSSSSSSPSYLSGPPRIVKTPASIEVTVSDTVVSFKCKAVGDPTPSIQWRKNSKPLPNDGRHIVRNDGTLDIVRPTVADEGTYECLAQNDAGEELAEAALRYQGVEGKKKLYITEEGGSKTCAPRWYTKIHS